MGGSNTDYSKQINQGLAQANLPKSPLSQQYSNLFGNASPDIMKALLNVQSLGNSYINSNHSPSSYQPAGVSQYGGFGNFGTYGNNIPGSSTTNPGSNPGSATNPFSANSINPNQSTLSTNQTGANTNQPTGDFSWQSSFPNIDFKALDPQTTFGTLLHSGQINADQLNKALGFSTGQVDYNSTDPNIQNLLSTNATARTAGLPGANPNYSSLNNLTPTGQQNAGGWVNPATGQWEPLGQGASRYLQNGVVTDQYGNPVPSTDPYYSNQSGGTGGSGGAFGGMGGGGNGSVNISPNGMPNGVNIPGVSTSFMPQNGTNIGQQIQQLLNMIGGNPNQVNAQSVQNPGFQQQMINPGAAQSNFNPVQADLSKVPNSTQLSPETSQGFDAIKEILNQQLTKNIADTRESAIQQGTSRSTGESYNEGQLRAAQLPQLAAALSQLQQTAVGNQLNQANLQQTGALQNAGMQNQYGLGGAQLNTQTALQNIQNMMQAGNLNNLTGLQARGQDVGTSLANASNNLGAQTSNQGAGLQNQGLNYNLLNQLLTNQLGQTGLGAQNNQFNAGANNAYNLALGGMNTQSAQTAIQNQLQQLMSIFGLGSGMAMSGIPGGSANVNIGNSNPNGSGIGGTLGGIGGLLSGLAALG